MSTHRTQWLIAQRMAAPRSTTKVTLHVGEIVSVAAGEATIYLNGNTDEPLDGVEVRPGLTVAVGQIVDVTFTGDAPLITARRT